MYENELKHCSSSGFVAGGDRQSQPGSPCTLLQHQGTFGRRESLRGMGAAVSQLDLSVVLSVGFQGFADASRAGGKASPLNSSETPKLLWPREELPAPTSWVPLVLRGDSGL